MKLRANDSATSIEQGIIMQDSVAAPSSTFIAADGDGYELTMGRWSRRLAELFIDFAGAADGEKVLDVGCGTGNLSFALAARAPSSTITGIDFSQAYIAFAKRKNTEARLTFETGDACAMPYADKSFDRVLSLLVLHFVREPDKAIAEMRRVARPGATVAATVWDVRGGFVGNRIFFDTAAALDPGAEKHRARYYTHPMTRPGELARAWRDAGFNNVREDYLTIHMEYEDFADYWRPVTGKDGPAAAYANSLPADARERFKAALNAAYCGGEADGPRSFAASAWTVRGFAP
jgi:ubiquinone/menaquinone biosynthesis C-methylase UbiE